MSATFTATTLINVSSGWQQFCAPIDLCGANFDDYPSNQYGSWKMDNVGQNCADWSNLISNVSGIKFHIELIQDLEVEEYGFDNICMVEKLDVLPCSDFNTAGDEDNWIAFGTEISRPTPGASGAAGDGYLQTTDEAGNSFISNTIDYAGDWLAAYQNTCICWDFKLVADGGTNANVIPDITLYQGDPGAPVLAATFTANFTVNVNDDWVKVCAPIRSCMGDDLPNGPDGEWSLDNGTDCDDWNQLLGDVTGIRFDLEFITNNTSENHGFDNICFEEKPNDQFCNVFDNNGDIDDWQTIAADKEASTPGPDGANDMFIRTDDAAGNSALYNTADYAGDWTEFNGDCLCWDFRVLNGKKINPTIRLFWGDPSSPNLSATFTATTKVSRLSGWRRFCAPIKTCGTELPSDQNGSWAMDNSTGNDCEDWNKLLGNVSGVYFDIEYLLDNSSEAYGFDNICIEDKISEFDADFVLCDKTLNGKSKVCGDCFEDASISDSPIVAWEWTYTDWQGNPQTHDGPTLNFEYPGGENVEFCLTVTNADGDTDTQCYFWTCGSGLARSTQIEEDPYLKDLKPVVYPNPTKGSLQVEYAKDLAVDRTIKVFNLQGQLLVEVVAGQHGYSDIDLHHLSAGIYLLQIQSGGILEHSEKIMIQP